MDQLVVSVSDRPPAELWTVHRVCKGVLREQNLRAGATLTGPVRGEAKAEADSKDEGTIGDVEAFVGGEDVEPVACSGTFTAEGMMSPGSGQRGVRSDVLQFVDRRSKCSLKLEVRSRAAKDWGIEESRVDLRWGQEELSWARTGHGRTARDWIRGLWDTAVPEVLNGSAAGPAVG